MPEVTGGDLRDIVTVSRINAIQGAIKALEGAPPPSSGRGRSAAIGHRGMRRAGGGGRFIVTHNVDNDRLYVREGWVAAAGAVPFEPTLDDVVLSDNPYFDIASGKSGDYEVVCYYTDTAARVELLKDSDEPDLEGAEEVFYLAKVNINGKVVGSSSIGAPTSWWRVPASRQAGRFSAMPAAATGRA